MSVTVFRSKNIFSFFLFISFILLTPAQGGPLSWTRGILPELPGPEDPHLYPQGALLHSMWTCKGENEIGWVGVTRYFTDQDPAIVVAARLEFNENLEFNHEIGVEIHAPRHNKIVASDRVSLRRNQDVGFFYHPQALARIGGWGEFNAVLTLDGTPMEEMTFWLERAEDINRRLAEEQQQRQTRQAFEEEIRALDARGLLGEPDAVVGEESESEPPLESPFNLGEPVDQQKVRVLDPRDWYRNDFQSEEGEIIVFPKKARKNWKENVKNDLKYRLRYYIFL